jgi:NADH dehydrogenase/NADH:ubiquinone oxidoreductase subunit G
VDGLYNSFNKDLSFVAIPSLNSIEFNGIYLNLEERPQETQGLKDFSSAATLRNCLFEFFLSKKGFIEQTQVITSIGKENFLSYIPVLRLKDSLRLSYIYELVDNCNLFDSIQKFLSIKRLLNYIKCSKYPFKSSVDDFYITNNFLRNSPTMLECSRESRKLFDNF